MSTHRPRQRGFALADLLAVVLVAGVTTVALVTTVAHARSMSGETGSADNLRTLHAAHAAYEADWNGRQLTFVDDAISSYGDGISQAFTRYDEENGRPHPAVALGWGRLQLDDDRYLWLAYRTRFNCANAALTLPINFGTGGCGSTLTGLGAFRLFNASQFNDYVNGRFYDETFYAPKDEVVIDSIDAGGCFDTAEGFCRFADVSDNLGDIPAWLSYCMSPAAMVDPAVMARDDSEDKERNGWVDPWGLDDGFRSPSPSQALYPDLKTFILEHHWLQNDPGAGCNPGWDPGTYGGCEPYYFNHAHDSTPLTLFYDGHIGGIFISQAITDDAFIRSENDGDWGLWSADSVFGADGYFTEYAWDDAWTSLHILTTDGIRGRDVLNAGAGAGVHPSGLRRPGRAPAHAPHRSIDTLRSPRVELSGE